MKTALSFLAQLFYNVVFAVFLLVTWPFFIQRLLRRGNLFPGFEERFGIFGKHRWAEFASRQQTDLWIHAVSVGEVKIAMVLLRRLKAAMPELRAVVTTTTATGYGLAVKRLKDAQTDVLYNPIDFIWFVTRAFRLIRPKILILVEAEVWPNLMWCARRRRIPVYLVNARLSQRTEKRYRALRWLVRPLLNQLALIFAQDETELARLSGAGFPPERIFNAGSLKYEVAALNDYDDLKLSWWEKLGWPQDALVLLGGSTHPGEEAILCGIYMRLSQEFPNLRLALVPRHAERGPEIQELCEKLVAKAVLRSAVEAGAQATGNDVVVVDSTGELLKVYARAALVFVGKSLRGKGGQNFIEAAPTGSAILVGPNMQNFEVQLRDFLRANAIVQVRDETELESELRRLLQDEALRRGLGDRAKAFFETRRNSAEPTAEMLVEALRSESSFKHL